jgi:hypothetical protein
MHLAPGRNGKAGRHDFGWEQVSNLLDKQPIFLTQRWPLVLTQAAESYSFEASVALVLIFRNSAFQVALAMIQLPAGWIFSAAANCLAIWVAPTLSAV